jgi:hypothetical protein
MSLFLAKVQTTLHKVWTLPWLQAHPTARDVLAGFLIALLVAGLFDVLQDFYLFARTSFRRRESLTQHRK